MYELSLDNNELVFDISNVVDILDVVKNSNEYLNKISHTINCITSLEDETKIRVGQPFYTSNMNELGDKIYGQENKENDNNLER